MKITKIKQHGYTTIDNRILNNTELSWKAKGIFTYLWSQADNWHFYEREVAKHSKDGRDSLRSGIEELERSGYLTRIQKRGEKGTFADFEWLLSEFPDPQFVTNFQKKQEKKELKKRESKIGNDEQSQPKLENPTSETNQPKLENPTSDKPISENPNLENPTLTSTNLNNTNLNNTNNNNQYIPTGSNSKTKNVGTVSKINQESSLSEKAIQTYQNLFDIEIKETHIKTLKGLLKLAKNNNLLLIHAMEYAKSNDAYIPKKYIAKVLNGYSDLGIMSVREATRHEENYKNKFQNKQPQEGDIKSKDGKIRNHNNSNNNEQQEAQLGDKVYSNGRWCTVKEVMPSWGKHEKVSNNEFKENSSSNKKVTLENLLGMYKTFSRNGKVRPTSLIEKIKTHCKETGEQIPEEIKQFI